MQHRGCRDWERQRGLDVWSLGDQEADVIPAETGRAGGLGSEWRSRLGGEEVGSAQERGWSRDVGFSGVSLERPGDRMYVQRARRERGREDAWPSCPPRWMRTRGDSNVFFSLPFLAWRWPGSCGLCSVLQHSLVGGGRGAETLLRREEKDGAERPGSPAGPLQRPSSPSCLQLSVILLFIYM